jgi:hypothetical protein
MPTVSWPFLADDAFHIRFLALLTFEKHGAFPIILETYRHLKMPA